MTAHLDDRTRRTAEVLVVRIGEERGYAWRFAVFTILLTPVGVALLALLVVLAMGSDGMVRRGLRSAGRDHYTFSFFTGMNLFFAALPIILLAGGSRQRPLGKGSLALAAGAAAVLLAISYLTPLSDGYPVIFWSIYAVCALVECAMLGRAYEPRDSYYLEWVRGGADPFSFTNNIRMRVAGETQIAGLGGGIAEMIFESYASIFASAWLIRGLEHDEIVAAAEALHALCDGDGKAARAAVARCQPEAAGAHVLRALLRMNLVHPSETGLRISSRGEKLLGRESRPMKDT